MTGRWPANVILTPAMGTVLDNQSGFSKSAGVINRWKDGAKPFGGGAGHEYESVQGVKDEGGASRFFLQAGYEPWELEWIVANGLRPCGE